MPADVAATLTITVTADQTVVAPAASPASFTRQGHRRQAGAPVRAQFSVGVIDEAVYGVQPDDTPDPLRFFYRREYSRVGTSVLARLLFVGYSGTEQLLLRARGAGR